MSPTINLNKTIEGKIEKTILKSTQSIILCLRLKGDIVDDLYFRGDNDGPKFYMLGLEGPAPIDFGLFQGNVWYRWVWVWEHKKEADEAFKHVPENTDELLKNLVTKINSLVISTKKAVAQKENSYYEYDLTEDFSRFGWKITIYEEPEETWKTSFQIYERLKSASR